MLYKLSDDIFKVEAMFELKGKNDYTNRSDLNNIINVVSSKKNPTQEIIFYEDDFHKDIVDSYHTMVVIEINNNVAKKNFIEELNLKPRGIDAWTDDIFAKFCKCYIKENDYDRLTKVSDGVYSFNYMGRPYSFRANPEKIDKLL